MSTKGARLLGRPGAILAACVACVAALGAGASSASATEVTCGNITASGSSLQNIAQKSVFIPEWETNGWKTEHETLKCSATAKIEYTATSSGKGLAEWGAKAGAIVLAESPSGKLDAFVGTDVGPQGSVTEGQIGNMDEAGKSGTEKNKVVTVPVAQSAIAVIVSLPAITMTANCTPEIKSAEITNTLLDKEWLEKGVSFREGFLGSLKLPESCTGEPMLEARSKASGTTGGFKRYLDDVEPVSWGTFVETAELAENTEWPVGTKQLNAEGVEEENNTGGKLAEKVFKTPATMGYADLADAITAGFTGTPKEHTNAKGEKYYSFFVLINNGGLEDKGVFESPEVAGGGSNCAKATYPEPETVGPDVDWSKAKQKNATPEGLEGEVGVYPICTLTFDVAWEQYSLVSDGTEKYTEAEAETVFNYLWWVVKEGQSLAGLATNHYAPLPKEVQKRAEKGVTMAHIHF